MATRSALTGSNRLVSSARTDAQENVVRRAVAPTHTAREDIHIVTDFDGSISAQLGAQSGETGFHVFVFGRDGELLQQWDDVPTAQELAAVVK